MKGKGPSSSRGKGRKRGVGLLGPLTPPPQVPAPSHPYPPNHLPPL